MPGYLIKTPFFTASIESDEELIQLAMVDTVKKDTMIRVLPGKAWVEASKLPLLRKIWGLDSDVTLPPVQFGERNSIPSINTFSVTNQIKSEDAMPKPGIKLPPRLETTIDINPLFRELYVESEDGVSNDSELDGQTVARGRDAMVGLEPVKQAEDVADPANSGAAEAAAKPDEASEEAVAKPDEASEAAAKPEAEDALENKALEEAAAKPEEAAEAEVLKASDAQASEMNDKSAHDERGIAESASDDHELVEALSSPALSHVRDLEPVSISSILAFGFENVQSSVSHTWQLFDAGSDEAENARKELDAFEKEIKALDVETCEKLEADEADDIRVITNTMLQSVDRSTDVAEEDDVSIDADVQSEGDEDACVPPPPPVPEHVKEMSAETEDVQASDSSEAAAEGGAEIADVRDEAAEADVHAVADISERSGAADDLLAETVPVSVGEYIDGSQVPNACAEAVNMHEEGRRVDENAATHDLSIVRSVSDVKPPDEESVLKSLKEVEIRATEELKTNDRRALELLDELAAEELRTHDCNAVKASDKTPEALSDPSDLEGKNNSDADFRTKERSGAVPTIGADEYVESMPEDITYVIASESMDNNVSVRRAEGMRNSEVREAVKAAVSADAGREQLGSSGRGRKRQRTMPITSHEEEANFLEMPQPPEISSERVQIGNDSEILSEGPAGDQAVAVEALPASDKPICALNRECDENALTRPIMPEDRLPTRSRIRVRKTGHGRYGYPPEDDEISLADEVVESDLTHKMDDDFEDMTMPHEQPFGIGGKSSKKSSDDHLFQAESLLSALERSSDGTEEVDENPSDIFMIRNRQDIKLRLEDHEAELEAEAGEVSASDKLRVREGSELRKMLFSKSKEEDTAKNDTDITVKDYANLPEGELRRIFEKSDELHLYLANEIREKESEVERSHDLEALADNEKKASKADKELEAMTSDMPVVSQAVVVAKTNHSAEPTHLTMKAVKEDALTVQEIFIEEHMLDGEEKIASFDTFYLTTHRVWDIEVSHGQITNYGSYDLEHISLLRMYNRHNKGLLFVAVIIMLGAAGGCAYVYFNNIKLNYLILLAIAIWAFIMLPVCYLVGNRRVLQIGTGNMVIENRHAIPKELSGKAVEFLGRIDAARAERRRKLGL